MSELLYKRPFFLPYINDFIYQWSPQGRQFFRHVKRVHAKAEETIKHRKRELVQHNQRKSEKQGETEQQRKYLDFLDVLLQARVSLIL